MKQYILVSLFSVMASPLLAQDQVKGDQDDSIVSETLEIIEEAGIDINNSDLKEGLPCLVEGMTYDVQFVGNPDKVFDRDLDNALFIAEIYSEYPAVLLGSVDNQIQQAIVVNGSVKATIEALPQEFNINNERFAEISQLSGEFELSSNHHKYFNGVEGQEGVVAQKPETLSICL